MDESIFRSLATMTESVIVAVSRGKDSIACLDLAVRHFRRVEAYCMTLVPGLSYVEDYLGYLERRYSIAIDRVPHWFVSRMLRHGTFRPLARSVPLETTRIIQARQKARTGVGWIISGEKARDSLRRRGMLAGLRKLGREGIDEKAGVCYPLAGWMDSQVFNLLKRINLPLPADYRAFGRSHCVQLTPEWLAAIKTHFPGDYAKIEEAFPFVGAALTRLVLRGGTKRPSAAQAAGVQDADAGPRSDQPGCVQPQDHRPARPEEAA